MNETQREIDIRNKKIADIKCEINNTKNVAANNIQLISLQIEEIKKEYEIQLNQVKILDNTYQEDKDFVSLKSFIGMEYEKIIGCYVIHNTENNKCYVGQSKDVMRRIKQHFKGTMPNNIIFAEDYYNSQLEKKEDLFELKILRCETKDELDQTERQLIEDYNARDFGYNGTSGNK